MADLVGALLVFAVGSLGTVVGLDRDRAFYPTIRVVIASYYALFLVMGPRPAMPLSLPVSLGLLA